MSNSLAAILHLPQLAWEWLSASIFLMLAEPHIPTSRVLVKSGRPDRRISRRSYRDDRFL
jgi:hypothetical protein